MYIRPFMQQKLLKLAHTPSGVQHLAYVLLGFAVWFRVVPGIPTPKPPPVTFKVLARAVVILLVFLIVLSLALRVLRPVLYWLGTWPLSLLAVLAVSPILGRAYFVGREYSRYFEYAQSVVAANLESAQQPTPRAE